MSNPSYVHPRDTDGSQVYSPVNPPPASGGANIPLVSTDPTTPSNGDIWDLQATAVPGQAMGLQAVTYTNTTVLADTLSIKTPGGIKRVALT